MVYKSDWFRPDSHCEPAFPIPRARRHGISEIARNQVKERLQTIPGVSEVTPGAKSSPWCASGSILSGCVPGVTASDVSNAISAENQELPLPARSKVRQ